MSVEELIRGDPAKLVWNCTDQRHWFHYTTPHAAEVIFQRGLYAANRPGLYVTDAMPGSIPQEKMLNKLFDGMRDLERVKAAVVLLRDDQNLKFTRVSDLGWWHDTAEEVIDLRLYRIGWCAMVEQEWAYHPDLYIT
jgi:hypothetical protein